MGYRSKTNEQERARTLRAEAWTLDEIAGELGVSKSSVSVCVPSIRTAKHIYACPQIAYRSVAVHRSVMGLVQALLSSPGVLPG